MNIHIETFTLHCLDRAGSHSMITREDRKRKPEERTIIRKTNYHKICTEIGLKNNMRKMSIELPKVEAARKEEGCIRNGITTIC